MTKNILLMTDSYNPSHQFLKINTDWEVSHLYNRKRGMILFGLEKIVRELLTTIITVEMVEEATANAAKKGMLFPTELWMRVVNELGGKIPLKVQALPDGTWCPKGTPFAQISNTVEGFGELVTWWEGVFMKAYFPSACATEAFKLRRYLEKKGCNKKRFHSFGYRGHRSEEDAQWAGKAWNLFLHGTDDFHTTALTPDAEIGTIAALAHKVTQQFDPMTAEEAKQEYGVYLDMPGDVNAMFHAIRAVAAQGKDTIALVIDTYDAWKVINEFTVPLANYAKGLGVHIVLRPDSGSVITQAIAIYQIVKENGITNCTVIIGEGMNFETILEYDQMLEDVGVPLDFVFYGIGGGFYNHIDRDYLGWAMKTAYSNGKNRMKFSEVPVKRSIPGVVHVVRKDGQLVVQYQSMTRQEYVILYYFGNNNGNVSYRNIPWKQVQERALAQDDSQDTIVLADEVYDEINKFSAALYG